MEALKKTQKRSGEDTGATAYKQHYMIQGIPNLSVR
jgi:hypothetical protein